MKSKLTNFLFTITIFLSFNQFSFSQKDTISEKKEEKKVKFVPVPYVSYNRTFGLMVGAVPMIMYKLNKKDTISPASLTGLVGGYTTNKSWFSTLFAKLYLKEDKWRILFAAGFGDMNSQFLLSANSSKFTNFETAADFLMLEVKRKLAKGLYLGGHYAYTKFENDFEFKKPLNEEVELNGIGLVLLWDIRDNVYYPKKGHKANINYISYPGFMGNDKVSNEIDIEFNKYLGIRKNKDVWAFRGYAAFDIGDVAFNNLLVMGGRRGTDLRGYTQGEYRGKQLIAVQTEYRYNFTKKMGAVGFVGVGTIFDSNIKSNDGEILPSIGVGYRYLVFPKNKLKVGLDVAAGKGDWGVYFRIGESF